MRCAAGGEVLAPGSPDDPLQWIDVRDLSEWLVTLVEHATTGTFNAVGPASTARWGDVLDACVVAGAPNAAKLTWVPSPWLEANEMGDDGAFPIWNAPVGKFAGFHRWKNDRAKATGLAFRPIADTVAAIRAWYPGEIERRVRVTHELEAAAAANGKPLKSIRRSRARQARDRAASASRRYSRSGTKRSRVNSSALLPEQVTVDQPRLIVVDVGVDPPQQCIAFGRGLRRHRHRSAIPRTSRYGVMVARVLSINDSRSARFNASKCASIASVLSWTPMWI